MTRMAAVAHPATGNVNHCLILKPQHSPYVQRLAADAGGFGLKARIQMLRAVERRIAT